MPKPAYIICSESGAEDRHTGLVSLYNLVDRIQLNRGTQPHATATPISQLRLTASWMRESADEDKEFEFEAAAISPSGDETHLGRGSFIFNLMFYRLNIRMLGLFPIKGDGLFWLEVRIRRAGSKTWQVQRAPLWVEQLPSLPAEAQKPPELPVESNAEQG